MSGDLGEILHRNVGVLRAAQPEERVEKVGELKGAVYSLRDRETDPSTDDHFL